MNLEQAKPNRAEGARALRAVCIARHSFLSEHIARYFAAMGVITTQGVGLGNGVDVSGDITPDIVICDYDLLAGIPLEEFVLPHVWSLPLTPSLSCSAPPLESLELV